MSGWRPGRPTRIATDVTVQAHDLPLVPLLHGFFRESDEVEAWTSWDQRFLNYWRRCGKTYVITDLEQADVVVIPADWYWVRGPSWASRPNRELANRCRRLADRARSAGKPVVVFFSGDRSCERIGIDDAIVFRDAGYRSRLEPRDCPMPAFVEDLVEHFCGGSIVEQPRRERPVIGFCGLAGRRTGLQTMLRVAAFRAVVGLRERRMEPSQFTGENLRADALAAFDASSAVDTNFVVRTSSVFFRTAASTELVDVRREYVENMINCDYVLCIRGSGNYSYRFYEALAMGRVPVVIDTDLALPFAGEIDWSDYCVIVDFDDRDRIADILAEFHASTSPDEFRDRQHRARQLWRERLSPEGFFARLPTMIGAVSGDRHGLTRGRR